ncbi:hypothetical protein KJZ67_02520 [Patescibacteria group bacterium]|nr:hypothetical protein [Patescibacteria group bacterium]
MKETGLSNPAMQASFLSVKHDQQLPASRMGREHEISWITADDVEKNWKLRVTRDGAVLIPGEFNWMHQSIALGIVWDLPEGVKSVWSHQIRGLGCDYVGPVLTASNPVLLEDVVKHPPRRRSMQQLMSSISHNGCS